MDQKNTYEFKPPYKEPFLFVQPLFDNISSLINILISWNINFLIAGNLIHYLAQMFLLQKSRIWDTPTLLTDADTRIVIFLNKTKYRIWETLHILPDADISININKYKKIIKKLTRNNSSFLRLYEMIHKCTSPPVKYLPRVDLQRVQSETTPCF